MGEKEKMRESGECTVGNSNKARKTSVARDVLERGMSLCTCPVVSAVKPCRALSRTSWKRHGVYIKVKNEIDWGLA